MIIAKLGMSLLGAAMKKGAGTAVTSGLASSLGKSALGALTGSTGGGKGGGKGGGMGGGRGGKGGQGGMSGKGGQGGGSSRGGQSKGQGGQGRSSQNQQDDFSLEDALNMLLEQNSPKNQVQEAPKQSANLRQLAQSAQNQDEEPYGVSDVVAQVNPTAPSLSDEDQVQIFQAAIDVLQAHIVSFSAGRVRVRHPQLQQSQDHAALHNALLQEGLTDVSFKASTGSALIVYDAKRFSQETFLVAALPLAIYLVCGRLG